MLVSCDQVCSFIETIAPLQYAMEGDPVGLQLGDPKQRIEKIFVALELDQRVLEEAIDFGANLIIVHHTPFFKPLRQLREDKVQDQRLIQMIRHRMALYTAHTNWDIAPGGVNDVLAAKLGMEKTKALSPLDSSRPDIGLGRIGYLPQPLSLISLATLVADRLKTENLRFCGDSQTMINKIACCGGSGISLAGEALAWGAQVLITGDVRHHDALDALDMGLCIIDAGHYATENPSMAVLCDKLKGAFPDVKFGMPGSSTDPFQRLPFY
jgi:dinuclear metal center YbgI/SA1388 family protein